MSSYPVYKPSSAARPPTQEEWRRNVVDRHRSVFDPPAWSSPSDSSVLQAAARALWRESCKWFTPTRQPHLLPRARDVLSWEHVRDAAETTATAQGVSVGAIDGCALVLVVEGNWCELASGCGAVLGNGGNGPRHHPSHPHPGVPVLPRRLKTYKAPSKLGSESDASHQIRFHLPWPR
jgi:hypothetical protein